MKTGKKDSVGPGRLIAFAFVTAAVAATAAFVLAHARANASASASEPAIPRGAPLVSWQDNGRDGVYFLRVVAGNPLPRAATLRGVVTSDTTCEPDALGFSHCHNDIHLANGVRLTVINTHQMNRHPCLRPEESVEVTGFDAQWVELKL